ncbi:hypothetical protein NE237_032214 [Protea cynaroides]|uniref:Dof zinc finger protein n=1 Tax=Protea cynaroides TaxID=273540 RepID=A0A9Q0L2X2_9MAGN|nr:hypothetical protein NE237_032214 [Protea cynaroides]
MLSHCEKIIISPLANEWPQQTDETGFMASSGSVMEKTGQEQSLKCPRCDSSNTKFCYYNNYSLSQPRHFCKSCKRYWTRGGTLRNVPVGGGCRKNKRVKRSSSNEASSSSYSSAPNPTPVSTASTHINPLFYGLSSMGVPSDINKLPYPCYDLHPRLNSLGLGFSSGAMTSTDSHEDDYRNGFSPCHPLVSSYEGASSLHQQLEGLKDRKPGNNHFQTLLPFGGLQMEVKLEERNNNRIPCQNPIEPIRPAADPSLYWNTMSVGAWADLNNFGSSVTSLI